MKKTLTLSITALVVFLTTASSGFASVQFDGLTWYHSEEPDRLVVNEKGHLVWKNPKAPDQVTVRLPATQLSKVGDVAKVVYMLKLQGRKTGVPGTDPTLLSGTGDLRIGLFDSNKQGHIKSDNTGYRNKTWCGYLGYCARICPCLPVGIKREHSDAIPGKFMKRTGAWEQDVCPSLVQKAGPYGGSKDLSGFGLELGEFSPLALIAARTAPDTVVFTVTLNGTTYTYVDDEPKLQPQKIDAMAIYFPNPIDYTSITLAGTCFSGGAKAAKKPTSQCEEAKKNVIVYGKEGIFCGWPANNGAWRWANEILVGFSYGKYVERGGHNITDPTYNVLARSTDGGETWKMEDPNNFAGDGGEIQPPPGNINFEHPDFAMRLHRHHGTRFFISYDRGHNWQGPYGLGELMKHQQLQGKENTSRTDYIVNGPNDCFIFTSATPGKSGSDVAFTARTTDGAKTLDFLSWIVPPTDPHRGVMPSTVRLSPNKLVTAVRRRAVPKDICWVDAYVSADNCSSWSFLSKVGDTGSWNGNPPALVKLKDGRLCCVFANRSRQQIIAKISSDEGKTWGNEIILRDDYKKDTHDDPDLGYPRIVQRPDGKLVTMYYWATQENPHHHIAATIWDPDKLK